VYFGPDIRRRIRLVAATVNCAVAARWSETSRNTDAARRNLTLINLVRTYRAQGLIAQAG
jgi:hypothetical protein